MGQSFTKDTYTCLKLQPDLVASIDIDTINNQVFSFMINDPCDYSELHTKMQTFLSMSDERLILTAKRKGISLMPLINATCDSKHRISLLNKIADYGILRQEYYNTYPLYMASVIIEFINLHINTYDFRERLTTKFNFKYFSHNSVLAICKKIKFDNEYLNRAEDILIEQFRDQILSMFKYLRQVNTNIPVVIIFKMIEGFYSKSVRLVQTLSKSKVQHTTFDYPVVPIIPDNDIDVIIDSLMTEYSWSVNECRKYLRLPLIDVDTTDTMPTSPVVPTPPVPQTLTEAEKENLLISQIDSFIREQNYLVQ